MHCQNPALINPKSHAYIMLQYAVCIRLSVSDWPTPNSFKSSIRSKWFDLLFPLLKLYPCSTSHNTSANGRRDTTNNNGDNQSPWKIPRFIFTVPRSVLLQIATNFPVFHSFFQQIYKVFSSSHQFTWLYHPWMEYHVLYWPTRWYIEVSLWNWKT